MYSSSWLGIGLGNVDRVSNLAQGLTFVSDQSNRNPMNHHGITQMHLKGKTDVTVLLWQCLSKADMQEKLNAIEG